MQNEEATNISSPQKRLFTLREELAQIQPPSYPDEFLVLIKNWITKATPTIQRDWTRYFSEFQKCTALSNAVSFLELADYGGESAQERRSAWDKDNKEAQEIQKTILSFLDGLLIIPLERKKNSSPNKKSYPIAPHLSGLFYLLAMIASVALPFFVFMVTKSLITMGFIFFFALLIFLLIGAFTLRQEKLLSEKNFMQLIELVVKQIPILIKGLNSHKNQ